MQKCCRLMIFFSHLAAIFERIDRLDDIVSHLTFTDYAIFDAHKALGLPDMLGHGENAAAAVWRYLNVLQATCGQTISFSKLMLMATWQLVYLASSPVRKQTSDRQFKISYVHNKICCLSMIIKFSAARYALNMDTDVRHEHESAVYDHYYERFMLHLLAANVCDGPPYEREAIECATRPYFFYQVCALRFVLIIMPSLICSSYFSYSSLQTIFRNQSRSANSKFSRSGSSALSTTRF